MIELTTLTAYKTSKAAVPDFHQQYGIALAKRLWIEYEVSVAGWPG